jgi:hypothetical protein
MAAGRKMPSRFSSRKTLLIIGFIVFSYGCIDQNRSLAADVKINKETLWIQTLQCGQAKFEISSDCMISGSEFDLNICSSQSLSLLDSDKIFILPQPSTLDKKGIEKAGNTNRLFVISWACVAQKNQQFLKLFYSDGGSGRNKYGEMTEFYSESLEPIHKLDKQLSQALHRAAEKNKDTISSIMPLVETPK